MIKYDVKPLMDLLTIPGVSGFESGVRDYISSLLPTSAESTVDAMGNLIASVGEGDPTVLFVAHMDEIGFLTTDITNEGFVRFQKIGTIDDAILPGTSVSISGTNGEVNGVIGVRPPHLGGAQSMNSEDLVIDVGVDGVREATALGVEPLQPVSFARVPRLIGEHVLNCRSLDDRFGCFVLLQACLDAVKNRLPGRVLFVWSVQEEVGLRGAAALSHTLKYDFAFPVDAYATAESRRMPSRYVYAQQGAGPVLRLFDHGSIASLRLAAWIEGVAKRASLPLQKGATGGETDGVRLQEAGVHMVPLAVAMKNLHSLAETADLRDVDATILLINEITKHADELFALLPR